MVRTWLPQLGSHGPEAARLASAALTDLEHFKLNHTGRLSRRPGPPPGRAAAQRLLTSLDRATVDAGPPVQVTGRRHARPCKWTKAWEDAASFFFPRSFDRTVMVAQWD